MVRKTRVCVVVLEVKTYTNGRIKLIPFFPPLLVTSSSAKAFLAAGLRLIRNAK